MKYIDHGAGGDAGCMMLAEGPAPSPGPGQIPSISPSVSASGTRIAPFS